MNTRAVRTCILAGLMAATIPALTACTPSPPDTEPVAIWEGGHLERDAFEAWITWQNLEPSRESVRNLALIESLAESARRRGLAESHRVLLAAEARRQAMLLPALGEHLDAQVTITGAELDELQTTYPEAFHQPRKLLLRGIYKRLTGDDDERTGIRHRMRALRAQVIDGADLEKLAARESESQSRFRDGSIGFVDPTALPDAVREGVEDLEAGEISPLIEHAGGLAFYRCERIRPEVIPDADEVRRKFRQNLFRERSARLNKALRRELATRIQVTPDEDPVLTVGDYTLPAGALDDLIHRQYPDHDPGNLSHRHKRRLLETWGQRVALADHAESLGIVDDALLAIAGRWHHIHALASAELRHRVDTRLRPPSEAALRERYEQRRARLRNPSRYRIAAIQFADADGLEHQPALERSREVLDRIRSGELAFAEAARQYSIHPSADEGGVLGWLTQRRLGSLDVHMLKPVRRLSPGEDTGLLRLGSGLWLIRLLDREPPSAMTFEQAREQLAQMLRQESIERLEAEVRERELADMNLEILVP